MSADATSFSHQNPSPETADFSLSPEEVAKGEQAASSYIGSLKAADMRRHAKEALGTLATVISGGFRDGIDFPWHQVRAYHGALAISIVKEHGAPAQIEAMRCRHDDSRKYQPVPEAFPPKQVQTMRTVLRGVIVECGNLGFISDDEMLHAMPPSRSADRAKPRERKLTESEVRALLSACDMGGGSIAGCRDALMICLAFTGGLRTVDLMNLSLRDLHFEGRTGQVTLKAKQAGSKRGRRIPLENEELISLEDWLEARGRADGPLFCPVNRGQRIEVRRMTAAEVRELCDQRAKEAGVLPFAPNDLAKSSPRNNDSGRRRRGNGHRAVEIAPVSPLYQDRVDEDETQTAECVNFPYRVKIGG